MKKLLRLILIMMVLMPFAIKAGDTKLTLNCPVGGTKNSALTCSIKITSDKAIKEVSFDYDFNDSFSYLSYAPQSNFEIVSSSPTGLNVKNEHGVTGDFIIGNLSFKILKTGILSLKDIQLVDSDDTVYNAEILSKSVKILSEDNTLKSLTVSTGTLKPTFNPTTTSYTLDVDTDKVVFTAVPNNENAAVLSPYTAELGYGENKFDLVVTSESGSKRTYKIVVNRKDNRSSNNNLKSITISNTKIDFSSDKSNYSIVIEKNVKSVVIQAELEDPKASFVKNYGPREVTIGTGKTTAELKVASENGSVKTYILTFVRDSSELSTNNRIKKLTIEGYKLDFNPEVYSYDIKITKDTKLVFKVELEDSSASYQLLNADLKNGNTITLKVTAENGDDREYKFNITYEKTTTKPTEEGETTKVIKGNKTVQFFDYEDFFCNENSIIYYLIFFVLGLFLGILFTGLVYRRRIKKILRKRNTPTTVTGNTEVLDFNKDDLL